MVRTLILIVFEIYSLGDCHWMRHGRKFDIGDAYDFSNWGCQNWYVNREPTGNKIPAGLRCNQQASQEDKIFGGSESEAHSHPWLVHIKMDVIR